MSDSQETNLKQTFFMLTNIYPIALQGIAQSNNWNWRKQSDLSAIFHVYGYWEQTYLTLLNYRSVP